MDSQEFLGALERAIATHQVDTPLRMDWCEDVRVWLVGNGGSAAIASHIANDMVRCGISALTLTDTPTLTAISNDFGYDKALAMQIEAHADPDDVLIAISSSGASMNIRNAVYAARERGCRIVTFSGFAKDNALRGMGDANYWVNSRNYGVVECAHMAILHALVKPQ